MALSVPLSRFTSRVGGGSAFFVRRHCAPTTNTYLMPLPQEFWKELPERTDEQLYDMLANSGDYVSEALEAVREELRKRNLPPERAAQLEATIQQKHAGEQQKADESLSWILRIVMFLLSATMCIGALGLALLPSYYESKGYTKKARQCWTWFGWGLGIWLTLAVVCFLLSYFTRR